MRSAAIQAIQLLWIAAFITWAISRATTRRTVASQNSGRARGTVWIVVLSWIILFTDLARRGMVALRFLPEGLSS